MNKDLRMIKKKYGENMSHLCRRLFPSILEEEGLLFDLLSNNFSYSKNLYYDLVDNNLTASFKDYIYSLNNIKKELYKTDKNPFSLMSDAGYDLYKCESQNDILKFMKYYTPKEMLCTFKDRRLNDNYVFFAVKKNVDKIKREDFKNPKREDEYGTSVISIQFTKGNINTLSIKNRYNHTVTNPDATFSNNLENIIEGLTYSFEKEYNYNISQNDSSFDIPNYVRTNDGKWYKYNYEINNIYYCENNIIIKDFMVDKTYLDKSKYLLIDYYIFDLESKKVFIYDKKISDSFIDSIKEIKKINIIKETKDTRSLLIKNDETELKIIVDKTGKIISYCNDSIKKIGNNFMYYNEVLNQIELKNTEEVGDNFLSRNEFVEKISFLNIKRIGNSFLEKNKIINSINLPCVEEIKNNFLCENVSLDKIVFKKLKKIGSYFMFKNDILDYFISPYLEEIGDHFMDTNYLIKGLYIPNIKTIGDSFLENNEKLKNLYFPFIEKIGSNFMIKNICINNIYLPNIKRIGNNFLYNNRSLKQIELKNIEEVGNNFLSNNNSLVSFIAPNLRSVGERFLSSNTLLTELKTGSLINRGNLFLCLNKKYNNNDKNNKKMIYKK